MPTFRDEDDPWIYTAQVPFGWGVKGDKDNPNIRTVYVVVYLDDHLEVYNATLCNRKCDGCGLRVDCLVRNQSLAKVPYNEPLGHCKTDDIPVKPYGCTMTCLGGIEGGSYPWPV
jgi:hypothetical protein